MHQGLRSLVFLCALFSFISFSLFIVEFLDFVCDCICTVIVNIHTVPEIKTIAAVHLNKT